ncbi:hypothetical protein Tco_0943229, partial [Tanacetum coccineum]
IKERCPKGVPTPKAKARRRSSPSFPRRQEQYSQIVLQVMREQLTEFTRIWHWLVCMMGDFNSSLDLNERLRSNVDTWAMDSIQLLLNSSIFFDIPPIIQGSHGLESRKTVKKRLHIR